MDVEVFNNAVVAIRAAKRSEARYFWRNIYYSRAWKQYDAPYTPIEPLSFWSFRFGLFRRFIAGDTAQVICVDNDPVGYVTLYWEDKRTRWLEVGITIFDPAYWGKGVGRRALTQWIDQLFMRHQINRIGLTTWSGNAGMMRCAKALGMREEGRLRAVRYYQGEYYDSLRYGVLRDEWLQQAAPVNPTAALTSTPMTAVASTMHQDHSLV
ncbi:GNAT family N-acetyltransferase [Salinivibrio sp. ES.052]|uniref:GNAT family N-acetyltransferase n=1 Tax=Salinivibrio sp. ES.052 TaxID=1882823 RepID=UPI00092A457E|nr:GNAT family protein [Salinivibrio sp. ES.052]SIO34823.1 Acetyltransferase (GNAT) domain-containing protein [Salinivibrio sp. ES.052]